MLSNVSSSRFKTSVRDASKRRNPKQLNNKPKRSQTSHQHHHRGNENPTSDPDFVQTVIGWTLTVLKTEQQISNLALLEPRCSISEYLKRYIPLILQDARAVITSGIDKANRKINMPFRLRLISDVREPQNRSNPWILRFKGTIQSKDDESGFTMNVLRLRCDNFNFIGIASENRDDHEVNVKAKVYFTGFKEDTKGLFKSGAKWEATYLGSLVTHERMFDACHPPCAFKPRTMDLLEKIALGNIAVSSVNITSSLIADDSLNASQRHAIESFLQLPENNIMLLQGPPGTGKTTTVADLLKKCCDRSQRTLVCAPSNKAVQVLAARFLEKNPTLLIVVTGVADKMIPELKSIFLSYVIKTFEDMNTRFKKTFDTEQTDKQTTVQFIRQQCNNLKKSHINFAAFCKESLFRYLLVSQIQLNALETQWTLLNNFLINKELSHIVEIQAQLISYRQSVFAVLDQFRAPAETTSLSEKISLMILNKCSVIFSTLSNSGSNISRKMEAVDNLIVDEAGQSVEVETLIALQHNPKNVLLVGDTKQLPATVISKFAVNYHYDWSMMARLTDQCGQTCSMLTVQYRMHPEICSFPSTRYYDSRLVTKYTPQIRSNIFDQKPFAFYNFVSKKGQSNEVSNGNSKQNETEAFYAASIVAKTRETDKHSTIGVITFYSAQKELLHRLITNKNKVQISTVDGFQGDECDIIIISFVRDNKNNQVGFVSDERRINVAITRAKHTLICLGSTDVLSTGSVEIGYLVSDVLRRRLHYSEAQLRKTLGLEGDARIVTVKAKAKKPDMTAAMTMLTLSEEVTQKVHNNNNIQELPKTPVAVVVNKVTLVGTRTVSKAPAKAKDGKQSNEKKNITKPSMKSIKPVVVPISAPTSDMNPPKRDAKKKNRHRKK